MRQLRWAAVAGSVLLIGGNHTRAQEPAEPAAEAVATQAVESRAAIDVEAANVKLPGDEAAYEEAAIDEEDVAYLDEPEAMPPQAGQAAGAADSSNGPAIDVDAAFAEGAQLQKQKKYAQARAVYERIIAAHPAGPTAGRARWQIAQTFRAEGQLAQAIPVLEMILADANEVSPKLRSDALAMLAATRQSMASEFAKLKKYDAAIAALQPTVDDSRSTNGSVRSALRAIGGYHELAKRPLEAVESYRQLLKRPASDELRLNDLSDLARLTPSAVEDLEEFIRQNPATAVDNVARAQVEIGKIHLREKQLDKALASFETVLALEKISREWRREGMIGKAEVALAKGDKADAVAIYRELVRLPVRVAFHTDFNHNRDDLNRLRSLAPEADISDEVGIYLSRILHPSFLTLTAAPPANDVLRTMLTERTEVITSRYGSFLRQTQGRIPPGVLKSIAKQLDEGGTERPFVVSDFSKKVAGKVLADAPLGGFLRPLLSGDHQAAARVAWREARLARTDERRTAWLQCVTLALQCQEQTRAGQAGLLEKWLVGKTTAESPQLTAMLENLGHEALPYEPSEPAVQAAVTLLGELTSVSAKDLYGALSGVVADNDVILVGVGGSFAAEHYKLHQWRSAGREDKARLAEVAAQLKHGGEERPFVVSEQAKQLAGMISDTAPLASYLQPLLRGDHRTAAHVAWQRARDSKSDFAYQSWIEAVKIAARCHDQALTGRSADFVLWTQGKLKGPNGQPIEANPLADLLEN